MSCLVHELSQDLGHDVTFDASVALYFRTCFLKTAATDTNVNIDRPNCLGECTHLYMRSDRQRQCD